MKVGFIGLGNVGGKLAGSLLRNGYDLTIDAQGLARSGAMAIFTWHFYANPAL